MTGGSLDRPSKRQLANQLREALPSAEVGLTLAGPSVKFGKSRRKSNDDGDRQALRRLVIEMSRREVLSAGVELEVQEEARQSIEGLSRDVVEARKALAEGSQWNRSLNAMQEACAHYRAAMRMRENSSWVFGEELGALRATAFQLADLIAEKTGFEEAGDLAEKIALDTAIHPMGPSVSIRVIPPE